MQLKNILALLSVTSEAVVMYAVLGCHHRSVDPDSLQALHNPPKAAGSCPETDGLGGVKSESRTTLF